MAIDYVKEGNIAIFTINRPEAMNSINVEVIKELHDTMISFRDDPDMWVGIITGAGEKAFSAGADIKDMLPYLKSIRGRQWEFPTTPFRGMELYKPLIAAINGMALGGGLEIALSCDIRIAAENSRFGSPEVNLGLIPGWGATQRLPRVMPWAKAAEILLTGKPIDTQEAYLMGLVNKVVPQDKVMSTAMEMARVICQASPLGVRAAKEAMIRGYSLSLEEGLRLESSLFNYLLGTEDFEEGTAAFTERRKPDFKAK